MSSGPAPENPPNPVSVVSSPPAELWHKFLKQELQRSPKFTEEFYDELRVKKLTFGNRVHCPFLRPFFLSPEDEQRVRVVAEKMAEFGERIATHAMHDAALLNQLHLREEELRLIRLGKLHGFASTASRLDSFLLADSLNFAEYNGESPAGAGYSDTLAEVFRGLPVMAEFAKRYEVHSYPLIAKLLDALIMAYFDWGGTSKKPQMLITDWREVPTWSEFEILEARFKKMGVPVELADPRDLQFDGKALFANGKKIDLVYRRVLINDIVARPTECKPLVDAVAANSVCMANHFRCKIPHVKAFFAVLTDARNDALFSFDERGLIRNHVPWTRVVADTRTSHHGAPIELLEFIRRQRQNLVLKPSDEYGGSGVTLGWESSESEWDAVIEKAIATTPGCWIVQERIPIRREVFPWVASDGTVDYRDMLVDFAPYLFRGKVCGFLTRLSATGLANVTSGGGQIPAFRVHSLT
jgi:circularly permuted ATPgrasp domain protein